MKLNILLLSLLLASAAFSIKEHQDHAFYKEQILGNLNNYQRLDVIYWWTSHCKESDKVCTDYHKQILIDIKKYQPQLAIDLELK